MFVEERNNSFSTNYLFNAKELDNETGLYYYGARYLDPTGAMWLSVDPVFHAGTSPYAYCLGNPVKLVDPDGRDEDETSNGLRIILLLSNAADHEDAALTRQEEIKKSYPKDKVIFIDDFNLENLKGNIEKNVEQAKKEGYDVTKEFSVFGHMGKDGPKGYFPENSTSPLHLYNRTGDIYDKGQMTLEGWKSIDYNFDPNNSIAAFYGCHSTEFAKAFMEVTNVKYTAGLEGQAGGTYDITGVFNNTTLNIFISRPFGRNVYMRTQGEGYVLPVIQFERGKRGYDTNYQEFPTYNNATVR